MLRQFEAARNRAGAFLLSMQVRSGVFDTSPYNRGNEPGMFLPGTYNAVNALALMRKIDGIDRQEALKFLKEHRRPDGFYRIKNFRRKDLAYPGFEYDDLHTTNYTMAAVSALGSPFEGGDFKFLRRYRGSRLERWLEKRDMCRPWTEGNYLVNAASFLLEAGREIDTSADMEKIIRWHRKNQDGYGFFHDTSIKDLTNAFAGATHNYHIYYAADIPVPMYRRVIDYMLSRPVEVDSACIDVDEMDVLFHFIRFGYRQDEIKSWVKKKTMNILDFQNPDGGFADSAEGSGFRTFDGWKKYREPQGISNCFATWFRLIALAMAEVVLYGNTDPWQFRSSIGIGYANPDYLKSGFDHEALEKEEEKVLLRQTEYDRLNAAAKERLWGMSEENIDYERVGDLADLLEAKMNEKDSGEITLDGVFTFVVMGEGAFSLKLESRGFQIIRGPAAGTDLTFIINRKNLKRLFTGRLDQKTAFLTGRLKLQGDIGTALKLGALL